jgi:hypothetical protein
MFSFLLLSPFVRIAGVVILVAGVFGFGWYKGHEKYADYKAQVDAVAHQQQEQVKQTIAKQQSITKEIESDYKTKLDSVNARYGRLLHSRSSAMQPVPKPATGLDATTPNGEPVEASTVPWIELERDCTITTQQLVSLQTWIKEEQTEDQKWGY